MRRILFIFCLLFFVMSFSAQPIDRYYFSGLSLNDGLSQITVTSIYQDHKGYMWFGTRNGLNRYDGYRFEVFNVDSEYGLSISNNHIMGIAGDNLGNLWVGTNNGLNKIELSTNKITKYFSIPDDATSISYDGILSLCIDDKDYVWIATYSGLNLYDRNTESFTRTDIDGLLLNNPVYALTSKNGYLYIGTYNKGVIVYNIETKEHFVHSDSRLSQIRSIFVDRDDNLWVGSQDNGLSVLKKGSDEFINYNTNNGLTNNYVRCIAQAPVGNNIFVGTFNGLNIINTQTQEVTHYKNYDANGGNLSHYSIFSLFFDQSETLWVGSYAGGINYYSPYGQRFHYYAPAPNGKPVTGIIGPIVETAQKLYIATEGDGLLEMDKETETYKNYKIFEDAGSAAYERNILKSLYRDGNRILCGTNAGTIYSFDLITKKFNLFHDFKSHNSIYYIGRNIQGNILVGGVNQIGLVLFSKDGMTKNTFVLNDGREISIQNVRCISEIGNNKYLIGTRSEGLYYLDTDKGEYHKYMRTYAEDGTVMEGAVNENYISSIFRDSKDQIWIGTFGNGLYKFDLETKTFKVYNTKNGLINNNVCAIIEDNNRHLWISTVSGISDFELSNETFRNYSYSSGIRVNEFTPHVGIKLSGGLIMFSGNNGFLSFNPDRLAYNPYVPPVVLENLYINNKLITPNEQGGILQKVLNEQKEIVLNYNESNITIEYSALNYIFANKNEYAYKLEGFDSDWNEVGERHIAYYTNIPPGNYTFVVRGSNNDGVWNKEGTSIDIIILPPFWKTWWAYLLYTLFIIGALVFIYRYFSERKRLENDIKLKQAEAKAQEEFHQERSKLFTNFSHELRTPLTLILSPLDDMADKPDSVTPSLLQTNLQLMRNNAQRLLRLVNNLMDFQKKESGTMKLKVNQGDFVKFTEEMIVLFRELAASRNINFTFSHSAESVEYWYDKNLMEKVYFNFLSNAFKNVPNGGEVAVNLNVHTLDELKQLIPSKTGNFDNGSIPYIILEINDSGTGIPESELDKIFTPFYQVAQNEHSASGTGLGLSLSKSIIEMHHGVIWAENIGGSGASFKCILPIDQSLYHTEDFAENTDNTAQPLSESIEIPKTSASSEEKEKGQKKIHTILVVEDNTDVRNYIISHLSEEYNILKATNGKEAIDKAFDHLPDLIISDIMMPKMNGMEMVAILKNDLRTSHIPVIMITAKAMPDDMKQGYEVGADDYITKPFNASVLVARIKNIMHSREKLKEIYGKRFSLESLGVETTSADDKFLQKLYDAIEKNVSNPELNLDSFSKEIGMSKANLYRKIKALTNLSPNEFVRNFRLETAAKILKETSLSVSEVYVVVGFGSHAYFSSCFKNLYGISPTEYANRVTGEGKPEKPSK